ncbi:hypothetical protein [Pedobacter aquatilis]|uniref:hypothetical protein n=1 Tax=Pedobacter aquatilis TaxID=351343 RepID=UPI00292FDE9D|nr:hypothetical protein [Pedobacter aquatilis]
MSIKITSLLIGTIILTSLSLRAQEIEENSRMIKPFKADGISNEWDEPLNQYNDATKLAFALANDDKNFYIIIESLDPQTTFSILRGGITLNINTQGKKKDGIKLVFPLIEQPAMPQEHEIPERKELDAPPPENIDKHVEPSLTNKSIKVSGFKNIKDGNLPAMNEYGVEAGMNIHPNRDLIYELSIPLEQLGVNLDLKKPIAYNIKINQPNKPDFKKDGKGPQGGGRPGGRGGMGGGMGSPGGMGGGRGQRPHEGGMENQENKKSDFWIKYKLAK